MSTTITDRIAVVISAATGGSVQAIENVSKAAKKADTDVTTLGKSSKGLGDVLSKSLVAGAQAFVSMGLAAGLKGLADAYAQAAAGAGLLARSTNATVTEAAKFQALTARIGLDARDLIEAFAQFQSSAAAGTAELEAAGVAIEKNANGTVNWTTTMVSFLDTMQDIPDATERNRLMFKYLGEEATKQFAAMVASGRSVQEAFEQIKSPLDAADVKRAQDYQAAMGDFSGAVKNAAMVLGEQLLPIMTEIAEVTAAFVEMMTETPVAAFGAKFAIVGTAVLGVAAALRAAKTAMDAFTLSMVRNPITLALVAATTAIAAAWQVFADKAGNAEDAFNKLRDEAIDPTTGALKDNADAWKTLSDWIGAAGYNTQKLAALGTDTEELREALAGTTAEFGVFVRARQEVLQGKGFGEDAVARESQQLFELRDSYLEAGEAARTMAQLQRTLASSQEELLNWIIQGKRGTQEYADSMAQYVTRTQEAHAAEQALAEDYAAQSGELDKIVQLRLTNAGLLSGAEGAYGRVEAAAKSLAGTIDDKNTKVNEEKVAMEGLAEAINTYVANALLAGETNQDIIDRLNTLRDLSPQTKKVIKDALTNLPPLKPKADITDAKKEIEKLGEDTETLVRVESRGGPAVIEYINEHVVTNHGNGYLAKIRVESRNGPAVIDYLDSIANKERTAYIDVKLRGADGMEYPAGVPQSAPASHSHEHTTTFDLRGSHFETPDPAAMYRALDRLAARRRLAGRRG